MNKYTFKRKIKFHNISIDGEFSEGYNFNNLLIFIPPLPQFNGSMHNPLIAYMFSKCYQNEAYGLRITFPKIEYDTSKDMLDDLLLKATIAYEEAISHFGNTNFESLFNTWLVGLSSGASIALQILKRRLEIHGLFMISPISQEIPEISDKMIPNTFYCYAENDPLTSVEEHKECIQRVQPQNVRCFSTASHIMSNITKEVSDYVFEQISNSAKYNNRNNKEI